MKNMLYLLFFFALSIPIKAQDTLTGSHGGKLKACGYYYVEVVECYQFLEIYFYEADLYPIRNHGVNGMVEFYFPDGSCSTSKLYPYGVDGFTAEIKQQCFESCEVHLRSIGISVKVTFTGFGENNEDCKKPDKDQVKN